MKKIRTRFAPSPTGYMHIGNLRTALLEYLITEHENRDFTLCIEDTDQERYVKDAAEIIYDTMKEVGLHHDEGPDIGGDLGPYVRSERLPMYKECADQSVDPGDVHYCFCGEEEVEKQRKETESLEISFKYDDPCKHVSVEEARERIVKGEKYVARQTICHDGETYFNDEAYGRIEVDNSILDESVLLKSDGYPTYNFVNIVDDHQMGTVHVVRGNKYLSSIPKYNLICQSFGWGIPTHVHIPPAMKDEQHKLSKHNGDASFQDLVEKGYLPEATLNYIALLGWSSEAEQEIYTLDELIEVFDIRRISESSATFDIDELAWMSGMYLRAMNTETFCELAKPYIEESVHRPVDIMAAAHILQPKCDILTSIPESLDFIDKPPEYDNATYIHKKMKTAYEITYRALQAT